MPDIHMPDPEDMLRADLEEEVRRLRAATTRPTTGSQGDRPEPFTAVDALEDISRALAGAGFEISYSARQMLVYRMHNGARFQVRVSKLRGR